MNNIIETTKHHWLDRYIAEQVAHYGLYRNMQTL